MTDQAIRVGDELFLGRLDEQVGQVADLFIRVGDELFLGRLDEQVGQVAALFHPGQISDLSYNNVSFQRKSL